MSKRSRHLSITTLPPHPDREAYEQTMARLKSMTRQEFFQSLVDAGIYTPQGKLAERYAGGDELPPVLPGWKAKKAPQRTSAKTAQRKSTRAPRRKSAKTSRH